jgi:hypothetical protein
MTRIGSVFWKCSENLVKRSCGRFIRRVPKLLVTERGVYAASTSARHPDIGCRGVFPIQTPKRAEARAPTNTNNLGMHGDSSFKTGLRGSAVWLSNDVQCTTMSSARIFQPVRSTNAMSSLASRMA